MYLNLNELPANLTSLVLNESAESASTLTMEFEGFLPTMEFGGETEPVTGLWLGYHTPVSLVRNGDILFHGKVTSYSHSNDGGRRSTSVTVTDALWLLDHIPFSAQVAEIIENAKEGSIQQSTLDVRTAANVYMQTWESIAETMHIDAPGWTAGGAITLDVSQANYSLGANLSRDKVITAWGALTRMQQANPDALIHMEPSGVIRVVSIAKAPTLTFDTKEKPIFSATDISPLYENAVSAVAVVVTAQWEEEASTQGGGGGGGGAGGTAEPTQRFASAYAVYPEKADLTQSGIKIFTATANSSDNLRRQLRYVYGQACAYYEAVNTLQWGGSVSLPIEHLSASPLMHRIDLSGTGAAEHWGAMQAIVTAVSWDFLAGNATLTLGMQIQDPELSTLEFNDVDVPGKDSNGFGGGGSHFGPSEWEDGPLGQISSEEEGPIWTWATHREDSEESESDTLSTDVPGSDTNTGTNTGTNKKGSNKPGSDKPGSDKPGPGPGPGPGKGSDKGSQKGSDTPPKEDTDTDTDTDTNKGSGNKGSENKGSEKPPTGSGNKGSDNKPSTGSDNKPNPDPDPNPNPGGGSNTPTPGPGEGTDGCACGPQLQALQEAIEKISKRLDAIDGRGPIKVEGDDDNGNNNPDPDPNPKPDPGQGSDTPAVGGGSSVGGMIGQLIDELTALQKQVEENGKAPECNCADNILAAQKSVVNAAKTGQISASGSFVATVETTCTGTLYASVSWSVNPDSATSTAPAYPDGGYS